MLPWLPHASARTNVEKYQRCDESASAPQAQRGVRVCLNQKQTEPQRKNRPRRAERERPTLPLPRLDKAAASRGGHDSPGSAR